MRLGLAGPVLVLSIALAPSSHALRIVEVSFDDADDGAGVATGDALLENVSVEGLLLGSKVTPQLIGDAARTNIAEGRYGRGALLDGDGDAIELGGFDALAGAWTLYAWVRVEQNQSGWLFLSPQSIGLRLNQGNVEVAVYEAASQSYVGYPTTMNIAADGAFHPLVFYVDPATKLASVSVDLLTGDTQGPFTSIPAATSEPVVGLDVTGVVDELFITPGLPDDNDLFDFAPSYCGKGNTALECAEVSTTFTPEAWPRKEPVRYKTVLDPTVCSAAAPCPLLIAVSDGGSCNDDYERVAAVTRFAKAGFHVVTVDPYCDASLEFYRKRFPSETSQVLYAKSQLFEASYAYRSAISGSEYVASGCSHGANLVARLALQTADYPLRTFVRSGFMALHCAYHASEDGMCPVQAAAIDTLYGMTYPHSDNDPATYELQVNQELTDYVTAEVVSTRELGASWGVDTSPETPHCGADGSFACYEQGTGFTRSGRAMRDAWGPSGYFFENSAVDCQHCLADDDPRLDCVACFLKVGRAGMESSCPACLGPDTGPAIPACQFACCPESGCGSGCGAGGTGGGSGGASAGGAANATPESGDSGGCGCRVTGAPEGTRSWWALIAIGFLRRLQRRRRNVSAAASAMK